jgi:hypothetical protein
VSKECPDLANGEFSLQQLRRVMLDNAVARLYVKRLAPNDNSKNQVYLGPDFSSLNIFPVEQIIVNSANPKMLKAPLRFGWINHEGRIEDAPGAQLILYPQYPEVRLSGFLRGCEGAPSEIMAARSLGRILLVGITDTGRVIAYAAGPTSRIAREFDALKHLVPVGVFFEIPQEAKDSRAALLVELRRVHLLEWINSKRLKSDGNLIDCGSTNCGGYTLEAELGIRPNGFSEPDFEGWEVKQHSVSDFIRPESGRPITLMTPEPSAGFYKTPGVGQFIRRFGYRDKARKDRLNFGGRHFANAACPATGLTLTLVGFDQASGKITDVRGGVSLLTRDGEQAATWQYTALMSHWNRKHAQAAYVPAMMRKDPRLQYRFGRTVRLGTGTDFLRFLKAMSEGKIYYDPGIKMENASSARPFVKRRSQFRIASKYIAALYACVEQVDLV